MSGFWRVTLGLLVLGMALAFGTRGLWLGTLFSLLLGGMWILGVVLRRARYADFGLTGFVALAVAGIWYALPSFFMLLGTLAALLTWDLYRFDVRLQSAQRVDTAPTIIRDHTRHLLLVAGLSLLLGGIALSAELRLPFVLALGLGLLVTVALTWALRQVR